MSSGQPIATAKLLELICSSIECKADLRLQPPRPLEIKASTLDPSLIHSLGWQATTALSQGVKEVVKTFCSGMGGGRADHAGLQSCNEIELVTECGARA